MDAKRVCCVLFNKSFREKRSWWSWEIDFFRRNLVLNLLSYSNTSLHRFRHDFAVATCWIGYSHVHWIDCIANWFSDCPLVGPVGPEVRQYSVRKVSNRGLSCHLISSIISDRQLQISDRWDYVCSKHQFCAPKVLQNGGFLVPKFVFLGHPER